MKQSKLLLSIVLIVPLVVGRPSKSEARREQNENHPTVSDEQTRPRDNGSHITLPAGTVIEIRIADDVNSSHNHAGDLLTGTVDPSLLIDNRVVIPRGTEAHMRLVEDEKGGHIHGKAAVKLESTGLVMDQEKIDVSSDDYRKKQGAVSAKVKNEAQASGSASARAATSPTPEADAVGPVIAVFRAAKVEIHAGTRIRFTLAAPFDFDRPADVPASQLNTNP